MFRFIEANECPKDSTKEYVVRYYLQQMYDPETTPIEERCFPYELVPLPLISLDPDSRGAIRFRT